MTAVEGLSETVSETFEHVQASLANHRKNCVALYKTQAQAAKLARKKKKTSEIVYTGEIAFGNAFMEMVSRVMVVKKGTGMQSAERVVKFVGAYVKFVNDKAIEKVEKEGASADSDDTMASRFISRVLQWIVSGFQSKDKVVRLRCVQIVSETIAHMGEVDEDTYNVLRTGLSERVCDKEAQIRAHSAIALSKLIGTEDPEEIQHGEQTILDVLLDLVSSDPAPEVRRAILINLPLNEDTLDVVIARARDVDAVTRKLVFTGLQTRLGHPRQFSIALREDVVKAGLGDREPAVRAACGKMLGVWYDMSLADSQNAEQGDWTGDDAGIMKGLCQFLGFFDVVGPNIAVAADAVASLLTTRPSLVESFIFNEQYWTNLTPESSALARIFVEHCVANNKEQALESSALPDVTRFALMLQDSYNNLLGKLEEAELLGNDEDDAREEEIAQREMILGELLMMALKLDYGDEIGRRKVFTVVKDMIGHRSLPPGLIDKCMDVLKEISPDERELIRVVVETVIDLRDNDDEAEIPPDGQSFLNPDMTLQSDISAPRERSLRRVRTSAEISPDERHEADMIELRCLMLCAAVLERVQGPFEDNSTLEGMLTDLIIPSVKRKELVLREKALTCLGLCCLIAKKMAMSSFQLFLGQINGSPEELKLKVLHIIFDILVLYSKDYLGQSPEIADQMMTFLIQTLDQETAESVQAAICIGISKLLLKGDATNASVLSSLVMTFISSSTKDNAELQQCLSYFFPAYCYSSYENQDRMRCVFLDTVDKVDKLHAQVDEDDDGEAPPTISASQLGMLLLDWTDPRKSVVVTDDDGKRPSNNVHLRLAKDILIALYDSKREVTDLKMLLQFLTNVSIERSTDESGRRLLLQLMILTKYQDEQCPFNDAVMDRAMARIKKKVATSLGGDVELEHEQCMLDQDFLDLFEAINITPIIPVAPEEEEEESITNGKTSRLSRTTNGSSKSSRRISEAATEPEGLATEEEEQREEEDEEEEVVAIASEVQQQSEDEEDEATPRPETPPPPPAKKARAKLTKRKVEEPQEEPERPATPPPALPKRSSRGKRTSSSKVDEEVHAAPPSPMRPARKRASSPTTRSSRGRGHKKSKPVEEENPVDEDSEDELAMEKPASTKRTNSRKPSKAKEDVVEEAPELDDEEPTKPVKKRTSTRKSKRASELAPARKTRSKR